MVANPSEPPRHFYSLDEYFALEHAGDARYEYWNGEILCMSGGSLAHSMIATNVIQCLGKRLEGTRCRAFNGDLAIKTLAQPPYRYPDASVVCDEPRVENIRGVDVLLNPVVIVEVLSPTTETRDRGEKFRAYQQIAGFLEYLLVSQETACVTRSFRLPDGSWTSEEYSGFEHSVRFAAVECVVSLAEIYQGVNFTTD